MSNCSSICSHNNDKVYTNPSILDNSILDENDNDVASNSGAQVLSSQGFLDSIHFDFYVYSNTLKDTLDLIVVDSVAALTPRAEIEGDMGDHHVGLQARLMSQALRKITGNIQRSNAMVIFINQIRMKIGVMFGNPETTTGGNALKFYSSVRLDIRRIGAVKEGEEVVGNETRVKVVKK